MVKLVALLSVIGLQKINETKSILVAVQHLKIFGTDLFLNTLNLSIPFNSTHSEIRIANLDQHTPINYCLYVDFLQIGMSSHFLELISKTLQYSHMKVLN